MKPAELQEASSQLVQKHVGRCVSGLVEGLLKASAELDYKVFVDAFGVDIDDLQKLCQRPDYESAAREFIFEADASDLESIVDNNGDWSDVVKEVVPDVEEIDDDGTIYYTYGVGSERFEDEDEARDTAIEAALPQLREAVWKITSDYEEVCNEHNLDYEYTEVYEYWVVSDWLARKLQEKGEIVGEVCGLTVWGRCTSGQSITIDGVIEAIALELA